MRSILAGLIFTACVVAPLRAQARDPNDLSSRVEILRTAYGVPYIRADDLKGFGYGLAWVQLEDYGPMVAMGILRSRGGMARVFGRDSIENDFFALPRRSMAQANYFRLDQATREGERCIRLPRRE